MSRWRFLVVKDGWCGYDIECLLRTYGIAIKDRGVVQQGDSRLISFTVKKSQADFAEYTLCRAGVEIRCEFYNLKNSNFAPNYIDRQSSLMAGGGGGIRRDIMTRILDFVSPLMGTKPENLTSSTDYPLKIGKRGERNERHIWLSVTHLHGFDAVDRYRRNEQHFC